MLKLQAWIGVAALLVANSGCGGGRTISINEHPHAAVNVTGTWEGSITSSVSGNRTVTLVLVQTGDALSGTYTTSGGLEGSVQGEVSALNLLFDITVTQPGCSGVLSASGSYLQSLQQGINFRYSGTTSCGGAETGTGAVTKP